MFRFVQARLIGWKNAARRKPLIIRGARQVGKTWLVENTLSSCFDRVLKIDLEKRRDLHACFKENLEPDHVIQLLEVATERIIPGKTLLFLDEIQACPRAILALRYMYEQIPELHVIAAGSLMEFALNRISTPVGRFQYLHLHPMTFYEYLLAMDKEPMARAVVTHPREVSETVQRMILDELKKYFFVGGMPECVRVYRETGSMKEVFEVQSEILSTYRDDFSKYTPKVDPTCLDAVFLNAARSVGGQIKYTHLDAGHSYQTNKKALDVLTKAKILHTILDCDPSGLPLGATANPKKMKVAMLDIGLLQRLCQIPVDMEMHQDDLLAMYRGKLAEQFAAQELLAWHSRELFYWARQARGSNAEIDFLVVEKGNIHPLEIKSGKGGSLKSLHMMLEKYSNCPHGVVLSGNIYRELPEQNIIFMPLYAVAILGDRKPEIELYQEMTTHASS